MSRAELKIGIDLVRVSRVEESIQLFGDRFLNRIFTTDEVAYARSSPSQTAERLAARFAAKEATKKALDLESVGYTEIEVKRSSTGACDISLSGSILAELDRTRQISAPSLALSLTHEDEYAAAVVVASFQRGAVSTGTGA